MIRSLILWSVVKSSASSEVLDTPDSDGTDHYFESGKPREILDGMIWHVRTNDDLPANDLYRLLSFIFEESIQDLSTNELPLSVNLTDIMIRAACPKVSLLNLFHMNEERCEELRTSIANGIDIFDGVIPLVLSTLLSHCESRLHSSVDASTTFTETVVTSVKASSGCNVSHEVVPKLLERICYY
jgi:hypothetical protein